MSNQQHPHLGQILISKGLISATQLDAATQMQLNSHKYPGETLIEQGLLNERQLKKTLKKQTNPHLAATLVAVLLNPFQMASVNIQRMQPLAAMGHQGLPKNLHPLTDIEVGNVNVRGLNESLESLFLKTGGGDGLVAVKQLAKLVMPMLDSLEAKTSMSDIRYETGKTQSTFSPDGSVNLRLPSSIGGVHFDNIRIVDAPCEQTLDSVSLQQIDLPQASLRISLRP